MSQAITEHFSYSEIQQHPSQMLELLAKEQETVFLLKRKGDDITICSYPAYNQEVDDILEEAKAEHRQKKQEGYTRDRAFQDFRESQQELVKYL